MLDSAAAAAFQAASRDWRGALAALIGCGPLLRNLTPGAGADGSSSASSSSSSSTSSQSGDDGVSGGGSGGGSGAGGGGGGGALGVLRALVQAPGVAGAVGDGLRAAGLDDGLAGQVDSALALGFDSAADLARPALLSPFPRSPPSAASLARTGARVARLSGGPESAAACAA